VKEKKGGKGGKPAGQNVSYSGKGNEAFPCAQNVLLAARKKKKKKRGGDAGNNRKIKKEKGTFPKSRFVRPNFTS